MGPCLSNFQRPASSSSCWGSNRAVAASKAVGSRGDQETLAARAARPCSGHSVPTSCRYPNPAARSRTSRGSPGFRRSWERTGAIVGLIGAQAASRPASSAITTSSGGRTSLSCGVLSPDIGLDDQTPRGVDEGQTEQGPIGGRRQHVAQPIVQPGAPRSDRASHPRGDHPRRQNADGRPAASPEKSLRAVPTSTAEASQARVGA